MKITEDKKRKYGIERHVGALSFDDSITFISRGQERSKGMLLSPWIGA